MFNLVKCLQFLQMVKDVACTIQRQSTLVSVSALNILYFNHRLIFQVLLYLWRSAPQMYQKASHVTWRVQCLPCLSAFLVLLAELLTCNWHSSSRTAGVHIVCIHMELVAVTFHPVFIQAVIERGHNCSANVVKRGGSITEGTFSSVISGNWRCIEHVYCCCKVGWLWCYRLLFWSCFDDDVGCADHGGVQTCLSLLNAAEKQCSCRELCISCLHIVSDRK